MKSYSIKGKRYKTNVKLSYLAAIVSSMLTPPLALANDDISYSYLEGGYFDIGETEFDPTGFSLKGSYEVTDGIFIFAETKQGDGDVLDFNDNQVEFDFDRFGFGVGYQSELTRNSSWFVSYSLNEWEIEDATWDVDVLRVGLRGKLTDNLELNASLTRNNIDYGSVDEDESGYQLGMVYDITDSVSFTINYEDIDEVDERSIGIRMSF